MEEETKKEYVLDSGLRAKFEYFNILENFTEKFLDTGWLKPKRTAREFADYIMLIASAKSTFWGSVYNKWPELEGKDLNATRFKITLI